LQAIAAHQVELEKKICLKKILKSDWVQFCLYNRQNLTQPIFKSFLKPDVLFQLGSLLSSH
jgi:hypothetical protein